MFITRRKIIVLISIIISISTLLYIDHPSIRSAKTIASAAGIIDSEKVIVGLRDISSDDHIRGNRNSKLILVEYSDFNCAFCAVMQSVFERLVKEKNIAVLSRNFPTEKTFGLSVLAECVAKHVGEDAYFEYASFLYSNQYSRLTSEDLELKAVELGIEAKDLRRCVESDGGIKKRILKDVEEGTRLGAQGTPYIVVVYDGVPIGISYANEYKLFLQRISDLVAGVQ